MHTSSNIHCWPAVQMGTQSTLLTGPAPSPFKTEFCKLLRKLTLQLGMLREIVPYSISAQGAVHISSLRAHPDLHVALRLVGVHHRLRHPLPLLVTRPETGITAHRWQRSLTNSMLSHDNATPLLLHIVNLNTVPLQGGLAPGPIWRTGCPWNSKHEASWAVTWARAG
jgi:hypothetical protein